MGFMLRTRFASRRAAITTLIGIVAAIASPTGLAGQGESVPVAAVLNGQPQGLFLGRSLLTGRAVCLLFLSDGRITRAIPAGGLEHFDWAAHRAAHAGDVGTWQLQGGQLDLMQDAVASWAATQPWEVP